MSIISISEKICKKCTVCKEVKELRYFSPKIRMSGKIYSKSKCATCYSRDYKAKNRELVNQKARERWKNVSDEGRKKMNEWAAEWRKNNPEKRKLASNKSNKKRISDPINHEKKKICDRIYHGKIRDNLSDGYVAARVIGKKGYGILFKKDIPQELIDMKRTQLLLMRQID
jgi:hypothetical protein